MIKTITKDKSIETAKKVNRSIGDIISKLKYVS